MSFVLPIIMFAIGVAVVVYGGDAFVDASTWIAEKTGIPKFVIGATVVSLATSLPEVIVSIMATAEGSVDMAVGNGIGSVSANIGLIMGISLTALPSKIDDQIFWAKGTLMLATTLLLGIFVMDGQLNVLESFVMLVLLCLFIYLNLHSLKTADSSREGRIRREKVPRKDIFVNLMKFLLGVGGILVGAQLLVNNGSTLARLMGVPEVLIGITLIAVGTSLPELITTISAITKKESSLSIGNIIGANIIDITLILSSCALISKGPLPVASQTASLDIPVTFMLMAIAVLPAIVKKRFYRWQGIALLGVYVSYIVYISILLK